MEKRLWNMRETKPEELVFTIKKGGGGRLDIDTSNKEFCQYYMPEVL